MVIDLDQTPASQRLPRAVRGVRRSSTWSRHERARWPTSTTCSTTTPPGSPIVIPAGFARTLAAGEQAAGRGAHRRQRAERRPRSPRRTRSRSTSSTASSSTRALGRRAGARPSSARHARATDPHLVQPGAPLVRLPDPRPDGRDHHDRHRAADGRHPGPGAGPGHRRSSSRSSPLRRIELMVGKLLPWTLIAFVDVVADHRARACVVFGVPLRGNVCGPGASARPCSSFASLGIGLIDLGASRRRSRRRTSLGAAGRLPAGLPAVRVRLPAGPDPAVPAVDQLRLPGPLHGRPSRAGCSSRAPGSPSCGPQLACARRSTPLVILLIASILLRTQEGTMSLQAHPAADLEGVHAAPARPAAAARCCS